MKSLGVAPAPAYSDITPALGVMTTNPTSGVSRTQSYAPSRAPALGGGSEPQTQPQSQLQPQANAQIQSLLSAAQIKIKQLEGELVSVKAQNETLQKRITLCEGDQDFLKQLDEENAAQQEELKLREKEIAQKTALLLEKDMIIGELHHKLEDLLNPQQHMVSFSLREKEKHKEPIFKGSEDNISALLKNLDLDDM